jgi:hypothetical protein
MKRRQLVVILVSILVIILILTGILVKMSPKERYEREYSKLKDIYMEKLYQGYDLSEAEDIVKKAKEAYNKGDYETALRSLNEAIIALERAKKAAPVKLHSIWTEEEYMEFFIQNYVDPVIPPLTKEQMLLINNDENRKQKTLKKLDNFLKYCDKKRDKSVKSDLLSKEKKRIFEAIDAITNSINQLKLKRDITRGNVDITYADYNKLRSSVIQTAQLRQELMKKYFEPEYDEIIQKYAPEEYHQMKFGVYAELASIWASATSQGDIPVDDILKEIDLLSETDVDIIMIYMVYDPWMDQDDKILSEYDRAVEQIRKNNKEVYIGLYGIAKWFGPFMGQKENVGKGKVDFETWSRTYLEMTETVTRRYNPDYIAVIEPTLVLASQVNEIRSPEDWIELTRVVADKVKEISPDTIVTIHTVPPDDLELFKGVMNIENVDIVGVDVYGLRGVQSIDTLLPYWNKEKKFWVTEAWDGYLGKYMDRSADKYIIASVYYAQSNNMTGCNLYYGRNLRTKDFEKTPAFYTYKNIIGDIHNKTI